MILGLTPQAMYCRRCAACGDMGVDLRSWRSRHRLLQWRPPSAGFSDGPVAERRATLRGGIVCRSVSWGSRLRLLTAARLGGLRMRVRRHAPSGKHGTERFPRFYNECRPESFESVIRDVFNRDIDALEEEFWRDATEQVSHK